MKHVNRALKYLRNYWLVTAGALISLLLVNAANLIAPQLLRSLIDNGITGLDMTAIWQATIGLIVIAVVRGVFNFSQGYWSAVCTWVSSPVGLEEIVRASDLG